MTTGAIVFDLDYTLAVVEHERRELLEEALTAVRAPPISREEYLQAHREHLTNETREPIFASLLENRESTATPRELTDSYRDAIERALVPVPGVEGLLSELGERYRIGLLTDGPVRAQQGKLDALGWNDRFDATVITGSLPAGKPDERAFEAVLESLSVPPEEAIYVGDDPTFDVVGASEAGLATIQVLDSRPVAVSPVADATIERDALAGELSGLIESFGCVSA